MTLGSVNDWRDMFPDTVTYAEFVDRTDYGKPNYGTPVSYSARIVRRPRFVRKADGSEVVSSVTVWLAAFVDAGAQDQITLPDGTTPEVLTVEKYTDESGDHHTKISLG